MPGCCVWVDVIAGCGRHSLMCLSVPIDKMLRRRHSYIQNTQRWRCRMNIVEEREKAMLTAEEKLQGISRSAGKVSRVLTKNISH